MGMKSAVASSLLSWSQDKSIDGFDAPSQASQLQFGVTYNVGSGNVNHVYQRRGTLAPATSVSFDLRDFTDAAFGTTVVATGAYGILVTVSGASCRLEPDTTNGLQWFFGTMSSSVILTDGSALFVSYPSHVSLSATSKRLLLTNLSGTATVTYKVAVLLRG